MRKDNRINHILKYVDKLKWGVEIGPSHQPIASKKDGFKVHVIDHASQEDLIKKYSKQNIKNIEHVDYIWTGQEYSKLIGKENYYSWVIASHVIEHSTDLIQFLNDCSSILHSTGVLSLAVPDYRYCFDHQRQLSSLSKIVDSHLERRSTHSPGTIVEYYLNVSSKGGRKAWSTNFEGEYRNIHSVEEAKKKYSEALENPSSYIDVHSWCFTPDHFKKTINQLQILGFVDLKIKYLSKTFGHEFFVTLEKQ